MKYAPISIVFMFLWASCSKSDNTSYSNPSQPFTTSKRLIKFGYEGDVYGVPPVYKGLADTPKHTFEGTGISESDFVKTKAGDTIYITIPLCSENTKPVVTVVEDSEAKTPVPPTVTEIPTTDATEQFRVLVK